MTDNNLYLANSQWNTRPADERFWDLQELFDAASRHRATARRSIVNTSDLEVVADDETNALFLKGKTGSQARITHYMLGQLSAKMKAPASFLRELPAKLAAENLNTMIRKCESEQASLLLHQNGELVARAINGPDYGVIWNCDIAERLLGLQTLGWRVPPARPAGVLGEKTRRATEADCLQSRNGGGGLSINVGDLIAPAGIYASDHDMFAFMVNENRTLDDGPNRLSRGFICSNSEVGAGALKLIRFFYAHVCGNHIVWGAENVSELKIVHRKNANAKFGSEFVGTIRDYTDASDYNERQQLAHAKQHLLGDNKKEVLNLLFGKKILGKKALDTAYDYAIEQTDIHNTGFSPNSVWGMVQGITRLSQDEGFTDARFQIDQAAGKVMQMAF